MRRSLPSKAEAVWWCLHTKPRQEKATARDLRKQGIVYYLPQVVKESRTPQGRKIQSVVPLFTGYMFMKGDRNDRLAALRGNRLVSVLEVVDQEALARDLRQIHTMLSSGLPVTAEADGARRRDGPDHDRPADRHGRQGDPPGQAGSVRGRGPLPGPRRDGRPAGLAGRTGRRVSWPTGVEPVGSGSPSRRLDVSRLPAGVDVDADAGQAEIVGRRPAADPPGGLGIAAGLLQPLGRVVAIPATRW